MSFAVIEKSQYDFDGWSTVVAWGPEVGKRLAYGFLKETLLVDFVKRQALIILKALEKS